MEIVHGSGPKIAGAKLGDVVLVHLINNQVDRIILMAITRIGIEGCNVNIKESPLTFYPFNNILKIKKYSEVL